MKMSDVFKGFVIMNSDPLSEYAKFPLFDDEGIVFSAWNERDAEYVAHAINQHDKLVELNKELVEALGSCANTISNQGCGLQTLIELEDLFDKAKELNK